MIRGTLEHLKGLLRAHWGPELCYDEETWRCPSAQLHLQACVFGGTQLGVCACVVCRLT